MPLYVLRVPVRYYRHPPTYFRGWRIDAAPHWGERWGQSWEQRRAGWDRWDRRSVPPPAPLPVYQQRYSGSRYPHADQQHSIRSGNYHYEPRDPISRERYSTPPHQAPPPTLVPRDRTDDRSRDQKPGWQKKDSRKPKTPKDDKGDHKDREHNHDHH